MILAHADRGPALTRAVQIVATDLAAITSRWAAKSILIPTNRLADEPAFIAASNASGGKH